MLQAVNAREAHLIKIAREARHVRNVELLDARRTGEHSLSVFSLKRDGPVQPRYQPDRGCPAKESPSDCFLSSSCSKKAKDCFWLNTAKD